MTRQEWMSYPPDAVTYTADGEPALKVPCETCCGYDVVAVVLEEED